ncbi:ferritin-like domain-containing protein, partial [Acinetobacter baumannii]
LIAERIAIESYREIIQFIGEKDPTTKRLMEHILAKEEEHADDMADLLFAVEPETGEGARNLYFADEVPGASNELSAAQNKAGES